MMNKFLHVLKRAANSSQIRQKPYSLNRTGLFFSHQIHSHSPKPPSFGIAFDIDGVLLRGEYPIGGSPQALRSLYDFSGRTVTVPYVFLTNGGGIPESKRAIELKKLLSVEVSPSQVIQGHSPFKQLVKRFENELVIAVGKGEPAAVMLEYGFRNVLSIDEYASCFDNIDPLEKFKNWRKMHITEEQASRNIAMCNDPCSQRVQGVFVVSDSVDWSRDIQVLCDILSTGGLPGKETSSQPPLYFASDDLAYQALFPSERLGMGAFRVALESVFNSVNPNALEYTSYGKPNPSVFKNAENTLMEQAVFLNKKNKFIGESNSLKTLYMIGDNPAIDINGARQAGSPWFSILTRTGVFKEQGNHSKYPADLVVDTVGEAVDYILRKESFQQTYTT